MSALQVHTVEFVHDGGADGICVRHVVIGLCRRWRFRASFEYRRLMVRWTLMSRVILRMKDVSNLT